MTFDEVLDPVRALLQQRGRVTYRSLKRRFDLDDEYLEDLKRELIRAEGVAADEDGDVLVWTGASPVSSSELQVSSSTQPLALSPPSPDASRTTPHVSRAEGERRQLTVMFIDLVGSTTLSRQLDPEDYHARVVAYQTACRQVIARYDGHIAQYLGDGVLVYFGYPTAHEEGTVRAVRSGLEIVAAVNQLAYTPPLQVRIGIHTGPVVVDEIGARERTERLALGETPNIAARVQGVAEPDTVVMSAATHRLVQGLFECQDLGPQMLKGISTPLSVYRVIEKSTAQSRFEVAVGIGLTPLVGREEELGLLQRRWTQAKEGAGQVVLLRGEPGIGKSRLVQALKEHIGQEESTRIEFRCSPYHQSSAFYPILEHLQRLLQFHREEAPQSKLAKLRQALSRYRFPQADTLPLLAALLSLPQPEDCAPLTLSPQRQKQKTQEALVAWIIEEAEKTAVYCAWEDLHWADPSTLEVLTLFLEQIPTMRLFAVLMFRPDFTPPWSSRSYLHQLSLNRLEHTQVEALVEKVTGGKALPSEVVQQIVAKTDGVPLFVEELTKTVLESGLLREEDGRYVGAYSGAPIPPLAIPSTLQDSLMARLDRLAPVREIAQVGAVLGREFSYELLHVVSSVDEALLQQGLRRLVEAELIYQRGLPPQATYIFKHALVQDTAYQSLLKSRRQQLHQQIAHVLAERFPETVETQPELLAHHYTEAGLIVQAISYWQKAGQRASQRSTYVEAISHLTRGLELLKTLPETPERAQQELMLQIALGVPLIAIQGYTVPEVEKTYTRALELCQQIGETPQLFPVLRGLWLFYVTRAELQTARELGEQLLTLTQSGQNPGLSLLAHYALGLTLFYLGELVPAHAHMEQGITLYDPQQHCSLAFLYGQDPGVVCLSYAASALWLLGYPDQAVQKSHEALLLAHELSHPFSQALALNFAAMLHQYRREGQAAQERAEAVIALSSELGFLFRAAWGTILRGWAVAEQGQEEEGVAEIRRGLAAWQATGTELAWPHCLALLAEVYGTMGRAEEGLAVLAEALVMVNKNGEREYEAELYRIKGELTRQKLSVIGSQLSVPTTQFLAPSSHAEVGQEAEGYFLKAIAIAQKQQAKSLELRAVMSLARLWRQQGKSAKAHRMLSEVYYWFTEGFETRDLQDAKALLHDLS